MLDILASFGVDQKAHSAVLTPDEFAMIFEKLTREKQIKNMNVSNKIYYIEILHPMIGVQNEFSLICSVRSIEKSFLALPYPVKYSTFISTAELHTADNHRNIKCRIT